MTYKNQLILARDSNIAIPNRLKRVKENIIIFSFIIHIVKYFLHFNDKSMYCNYRRSKKRYRYNFEIKIHKEQRPGLSKL